MANDFSEIAVLEEPLRVPPAELSPRAGAVVDFLGVVRGNEGAEPISGLDYEAHREMARHQLEKIANTAHEKFRYEKLALLHRVGFVPVAEISLFVRVYAAHRQEAFAACEWIIEQLKMRVPIWKKPILKTERA